MNTLDEQQFYTPAEAAPKLRIKTDTVWRWIRTGKLKASPGHRKLIAQSEIERALGVDANSRQAGQNAAN